MKKPIATKTWFRKIGEHDAMSFGGVTHYRDAWLWCALFAGLFLVFSAPIHFPYLLLDDNWIMRGGDPGAYPGTRFIAITQGRPLFSLLIIMSRGLVAVTTQLDAMILIRLSAIGLLAFSCLLIQKFIESVGFGFWESLAISVGAITLPTFQVYVGNGPWLSLPFALVIYATYKMRVGLRDGDVSILRLLVIQQFLLFCALGVYQTIVLVPIALALMAVLFGTKLNDRFVLFTIGNVIVTIAIYYVLWRLAYSLLAGGKVELRYSPQNVTWDVGVWFWRLVEFRLPQALNLWRISADGTGYVVLGFIFVGALAGTCKRGRHGNGLNRLSIQPALRGFAALGAAFLLSDAIALASSKPIASYTSLTALSLAAYFAVIWASRSLISSLPLPHEAVFRFATILLMVMGLVTSQYTLGRRFAVPVWVESQLVRDRLEYSLRNSGGIDEVVVYLNKKLFVRGGVYEYTFSNLENLFYVRWTIRNILRDLGVSEDVEIKLVAEGQKLGLSALLDKSGKDRRLVVIDLSGSSGNPQKFKLIDEQTLKAVSHLGKLLEQGDEDLFKKDLANAREKYGPAVLDVDLETGRSLLTTALCNRRNLAVLSLLQSGADPNRIDANGAVPVACVGDIPQLKILIAHGLKELAKDSAGMPTLHVLVEANRVDAVRFLLDQGYDVDPTGGDGRIPLHTAAHYGYLEMVQLLLSRGSRVNVKTLYGVTPLDWAIANNHAQTVKVLREHGALSASQIVGR